MERRNKYEEVAADLVARLRQGEFQPGDRLPAERTLATEYGVSRSVIREAVRAMEQLGCVTSRVGGGSYVKTPDASSIADSFSIVFEQDGAFAEELIETRLILETQIARMAAQRRTQNQLEAMEQTITDMKEALDQGKPGEQLDARFHQLLADAAGNRVLAAAVSAYSELMNQSLRITQYMDGVPVQTLQDHQRILDALKEKNENDAEHQMREHLLRAQENLSKKKA